MCRFALYLGTPITIGSLVTEPSHSIIHQSFRSEEREEPLNGDGFGVAWYAEEDPRPAVFRDISPAWSDMNLRALSRVTRSRAIMVHIRAASPGLPVQQLNCHPFASDRYAFMHNGVIGGFLELKRKLREGLTDASYDMVQGTTDSEHLFALFLDRLAEQPEGDALERMAAALTAAIADTERLRSEVGVAQRSRLNLAVCNGAEAVIARYASPGEGHNSLYLHAGTRYVCERGVCRMLPPEAGNHAVIVASEPLSEDDGWTPVAANSLVLIRADLSVEQRAIPAA